MNEALREVAGGDRAAWPPSRGSTWSGVSSNIDAGWRATWRKRAAVQGGPPPEWACGWRDAAGASTRCGPVPVSSWRGGVLPSPRPTVAERAPVADGTPLIPRIVASAGAV